VFGVVLGVVELPVVVPGGGVVLPTVPGVVAPGGIAVEPAPVEPAPVLCAIATLPEHINAVANPIAVISLMIISFVGDRGQTIELAAVPLNSAVSRPCEAACATGPRRPLHNWFAIPGLDGLPANRPPVLHTIGIDC
jgi:hypothetical protein